MGSGGVLAGVAVYVPCGPRSCGRRDRLLPSTQHCLLLSLGFHLPFPGQSSSLTFFLVDIWLVDCTSEYGAERSSISRHLPHTVSLRANDFEFQ